jgi:hypothetical protein
MEELDKKTKKTEKELNVAKDASIDFPVEVIATEADPYHETGIKFHAGKKKAEELVKRGWVKFAMIALLAISGFGAIAQESVYAPLYNPGTTYSLTRLNSTTVVRDTVTDTGTGYLNSKRIAGPGAITIQVNVQKVSGTIAGSLTLSGSTDGVYYATIPTEETQTAVTVGTLTDQSGVKAWVWRIKTSPFLYYRVTASGGTTTVYYLNGFILKH